MATRTKKQPINLKKDKVIKVDIADVDRQDFLDYGIAVASDRAIPNVLDGLKPVQRRILYAMERAKLFHAAKHKKSQAVVGDVMGNWHPHGDSYGSVDYLTEQFVFPLAPIEGRGSFTDISGNTAAAARYTEVRFSKYGDLMTQNLSEKLVSYEDNYDNTKRMPKVFPAKLPFLLINGVKTGIAVGFTSSIAPHNPVDATKLVKAYLAKPNMSLDEAIEIIKAPDLPTGGILIGDIRKYYETGNTKLQNQGVVEDDPDDANTLIIREVPYNMGGAINSYVDKVKDMLIANKLKGITEIDDYTSDEDIAENKVRIEIKLQKGFNHTQAKALLFAKTDLRQTYSLTWMALDSKTPKQYNLLQYLETFANFQHKLVVREFKAELAKATDRLEIVDGLISVPANLDALIHAAQNTDGKQDLMEVLQGLKTIDNQLKSFNYTERQADAIASMRVYQLNRVDAQKLIEEKADLENRIYWANRYITEPDLRVKLLTKRLDGYIKDLTKDGFDQRRTQLLDENVIDQVTVSEIVSDVTITRDKYGYLKLTDRKTVSAEDIIQTLDTTDDDVLVIMTKSGEMYQVAVNKMKKYSNRDQGRGDAILAVFADTGYQETDEILAVTTKHELENPNREIIMVSSRGLAKRFNTSTSKLITKTMRKKLDLYKSKFEGDNLTFIDFKLSSELEYFDIIAARNNTYKRLPLTEIKFQGTASGAGAQTFTDKTETIIDSVIVVNTTTDTSVILNDSEVELANLPVLKATQIFKPIK